MIPIRFQNCTMGVFGLKSWDPARPLRSQAKTTNSSRNNPTLDWNAAQGSAEHDQRTPTGHWPNPVSSVFIPKMDITAFEDREVGRHSATENGQSVRMGGQWHAGETRQWAASGNGQPTGMSREWSPGQERLSSETGRQWSSASRNAQVGGMERQGSVPGNAQPASVNRQWSAPGTAQPVSENRQWSGGNAQPVSEGRQWSNPGNAQPSNEGRQWSAPGGNAQPVSENRQWSAPGTAQPVNDSRQRSASDQWSAAKENGQSTLESRQWSTRDRAGFDDHQRREDQEIGHWPNPNSKDNPPRSEQHNSYQDSGRPKAQAPNRGPSEVASKVEPPKSSGYRLIAKHNYTANPNSPLGAGAELSFKQAEQLTKIGVHPEQELWWRAKNENGQQGYVPSTYMMVIEETGTLPWLQNRVVEETVEEPAIAKPYEPYRSAYNKSASGTTVAAKYYCEICERSFNGPQPYSAHMASKVHRETVEARREEFPR